MEDDDAQHSSRKRPGRTETLRQALEAMALRFEQEADNESGEIREQRLQEAERWRELAEEFSRCRDS